MLPVFLVGSRSPVNLRSCSESKCGVSQPGDAARPSPPPTPWTPSPFDGGERGDLSHDRSRLSRCGAPSSSGCRVRLARAMATEAASRTESKIVVL